MIPRFEHAADHFKSVSLGIFLGCLISITPLLFFEFFSNRLPIPMRYSPIIPFVLTLLALVFLCFVRILMNTFSSLRDTKYSISYIFFIPIFLHIFFAGFKLDLSNLILILYILTFIALLYLGKIDKVVIAPILYFVVIHFAICNITLLMPRGLNVVAVSTALVKLNVKLLLFFLVLNALTKEQELKSWFRIYLVMCIFAALVAIAQMVMFYVTGINYSLAEPEMKRVVPTPIGGYPRVSAFFQHPTVMAIDIAPMFMMLLYAFFSPEYIKREKRMALLLPLGLLFITLFLSTSRGTWVAIFFGCVAIFFMKRPDLLLRKIAFVTILLVISYLTGLLDLAYEFLVSLNESSVSARAELFELGLVAIQEYPLLGYGLSHFVTYTGNYWNLPVHSSPFQILSETGILGLISYYSIVAYLVWRVIGQLRKTKLGGNKILLEAYLIALMTLVISNGFQQITWATFTFFLFALGECIVRIVRASEESGRELKVLEL